MWKAKDRFRPNGHVQKGNQSQLTSSAKLRAVSQCDNSPSTLNACTTNKFPPNISQLGGGLPRICTLCETRQRQTKLSKT